MPIPPTDPGFDRSLLRDDVYRRLRDAIVDGTFAPGEQLEDLELAAWLGVSRTPVREALLRLTHTGLVLAQPGRSTIVGTLDAREMQLPGSRRRTGRPSWAGRSRGSSQGTAGGPMPRQPTAELHPRTGPERRPPQGGRGLRRWTAGRGARTPRPGRSHDGAPQSGMDRVRARSVPG